MNYSSADKKNEQEEVKGSLHGVVAGMMRCCSRGGSSSRELAQSTHNRTLGQTKSRKPDMGTIK